MVFTGDIGVVCVHHSTELGLETSESETYIQLTIFHVTTRIVHSTMLHFTPVSMMRLGSGGANCLALPFAPNTNQFFPLLSPSMGRLRRARVHNARRDVHRASRTRVSVLTCTFEPFLMNI